jgi:hypothetical protein
MTDAELRVRIRDMMASVDLPSEPPVIHRAGEVSRLPCLICGEPDPSVAFFWTGGHDSRFTGLTRPVLARSVAFAARTYPLSPFACLPDRSGPAGGAGGKLGSYARQVM